MLFALLGVISLLATVAVANGWLTAGYAKSIWSWVTNPPGHGVSLLLALLTVAFLGLAIPPETAKKYFIALWKKEREHKADALYDLLEPPARLAKILLQMVIGVVAVVLIVRVTLNARHDQFPNNLPDATDTITIIAGGLAIAAAAELAYTLFTEGPDEAIDPLILGISSALLFKLAAQGTVLDSGVGIATLLMAIGLAVLFAIRREFIGGGKEAKVGRRRTKRIGPLSKTFMKRTRRS